MGELLCLTKEMEYPEEEAVGYQKLLEETCKKLMLEGLLLVLLGNETSSLSCGSLISSKAVSMDGVPMNSVRETSVQSRQT